IRYLTFYIFNRFDMTKVERGILKHKIYNRFKDLGSLEINGQSKKRCT
ncbi:unnamed protein product, partial [marine sediment metagenome]